MMKAIAIKSGKWTIRALIQAVRKGRIKRNGRIEQAEVVAVLREFLDLIIDELDLLTGSRHSTESEIINDIRYRVGQLVSRLGR